MTEEKPKQGWAFVLGIGFATKKAHYIGEDHRSLCGRYLWFGYVEEGKDNSPDNCAECKRRLKKLKEKKVTKITIKVHTSVITKDGHGREPYFSHHLEGRKA